MLIRFLLARFHVQSLEGVTNQEELEAALNDLSDSLPKAYEIAVARIRDQSSRRKELAKRLIAWAVFAIQPLDSVGLQHALAVDLGDQTFNPKRITSIEMILSVSAGLITWDFKSDAIRPVHETAQEFFSGNADLWNDNPQIYLGKTCLKYILFFEEHLKRSVYGADIDYLEGAMDNEDSENTVHLELAHDRVDSPKPRNETRITDKMTWGEMIFLKYALDYWANHIGHVQDECMQEVLFVLTRRHAGRFCTQFLRGAIYSFHYHNYGTSTGLHIAARYGLEKICEALLNRGVSLDALDERGETALSIAARMGYSSMIKPLCSPKTLQITRPHDRYTPLIAAAELGHADTVKQLLRCGAKNVLLQSGADVKAEGFLGETALYKAAQNGHSEIVDCLLQSGADSNARDFLGDTALHKASENGQGDIVDLLLRSGADINAQDRCAGTALHKASENGQGNIIDYLLRSGADINAQDVNGKTALHRAAVSGNSKIVNRLLQADANIEARTADARTPLHYACRYGPVDKVELLVRFGADVNAVDCTGRTPLDIAIYRDRSEITRFLFESPILRAASTQYIKSRDKYGNTPLHKVCRNRSIEMVEAFVRFGADVNAVNYVGVTPLDVAVYWNRSDITRFLSAMPSILSWRCTDRRGHVQV